MEPEYLAVVDPDTLEPVDAVDGRVLVVVAARVGPARLIDNVLIDTEQVATRVAGVNQAKERAMSTPPRHDHPDGAAARSRSPSSPRCARSASRS